MSAYYVELKGLENGGGDRLLDDYNKMELQTVDIQDELEWADTRQSHVASVCENGELGNQLKNCQLRMEDVLS